MSPYSELSRRFEAMGDELEKIALLGRLWRANQWWGRGAGAALGAGVGAGVGYVRAPDDGSGKAPSMIGHALLGAGAGALGGQFATRAGTQQAKRVGQRQLHGFTGKLPGHGFRESFSVTKPERIKALKEMKWGLPEELPAYGPGGKPTEEAVRQAVAKARAKAQEGGFISRSGLAQRIRESKPYEWWTRQRLQGDVAQQQLAEAGMTSLPGTLKGYLTGTPELTRRGALLANLRAPGVVLGAGIPLAASLPSAMESVEQRDVRPLIRSMGENVAYTALGGLPAAPMMVAGDLISRGMNRALPNRRVLPPQEIGQ